MTSKLEESPCFVSPTDGQIHVGQEIIQGDRGNKGGVAIRMLCGWMGFVVSRQLVQENPTCPKCVDLFKGQAAAP